MSIIKQVKNKIIKLISNGEFVPESLLELCKYFINNKNIEFEEKFENGEWIAVSTNFKNGSIVTSAKNETELEENIKDAILTSFDVPHAYLDEVGLYREKIEEYSDKKECKKVIYAIA